MDNNMNVVDNNVQQTPNNNMEMQPMPEQPISSDMGPQPMPEQPIPNSMGPQPMSEQPIPNGMGPQPMPQQPIPNGMGPQPMPEQPIPNNMGPQPMNQEMAGEVPVINIEQSPTEVFGQQVNVGQPNDPTKMNQMLESINVQQQPETPKYGYTTNEQKPDLNADSNINIKVIIFIAIIILGFIIALPYLSSLLDK